jgi:MFS family permease
MEYIDVMRKNIITLLNSIITFLGFLDTHLLIPVIALYAVHLGASISTVGLIVGIYSLTNFFINIIGGRCIDKFGYKAPLIGGLFGDAIAMFGYTLCAAPWHLALARAFHGISGGFVGPATMSVMALNTSPENKGKTMSYYGIAIATSTLIGYGVGGTVVSKFGFNPLFYTGAGIVLIGVIISYFLPKMKKQDHNEYKVVQSSIKDTLKTALRGKAAISYLAVFAQYFSFGGVVTLLPLYIKGFNLDAFYVGILLAIFSLTFIVTQLLGGNLSDRIGRLIPIASGLGLASISLILLPFANLLATLAVIMGLYGISYGLLFPSISALLADSVSSEQYGVATGIFHALITLGVAVGAPLIGVIGEHTSVRTGLILIFIIFIPVLIITLIRLRRERKSYSVG